MIKDHNSPDWNKWEKVGAYVVLGLITTVVSCVIILAIVGTVKLLTMMF